jgi:hypothetical protein
MAKIKDAGDLVIWLDGVVALATVWLDVVDTG